MPSSRNIFPLKIIGGFADGCENVLAFGNPGSGKTHLLCTIGQEMIQQHGKRILFTPCNLMVQNLLIAKRDLKLSRALKSLSRYDAIIIDDIGCVLENPDNFGHRFRKVSDSIPIFTGQ